MRIHFLVSSLPFSFAHQQKGRVFVLCLLVLLLSGCSLIQGKKRLPVPSKPSQYKSEAYYQSILDSKETTFEERTLALGNLAGAALENNHPEKALEALQNQATLQPEAMDTWQWQVLYADALLALGREDEVRNHLTMLLHDEGRIWDTRFKAGITLARLDWNARRLDQSMATLANLYAMSPSPATLSRSQLEQALLTELINTEPSTLQALLSSIPAQKQWQFPYTVIQLEQLRRMSSAQLNETGPAGQLLNNLHMQGEFADIGLVQRTLIQVFRQEQGAGQTIALALPLTGSYREISQSLLRGAVTAQGELLSQDKQLAIQVINTQSPTWKQQLAALPANGTVVGGPLRSARFEELVQAGLTQARPYFTFLSHLGTYQEGHDAWRFFPGSDDQTQMLLALATAGLGIKEFGILYPEESYGQRLFQQFSAQAQSAGLPAPIAQSYPPLEPQQWGGRVESFLKQMQGEGTAPSRQSPFKALFVPDGWSQAKLLIPQLFFYDEDRLLIMGPSLWGQALAEEKNLEANYFQLAVFPHAWWPQNPAQGTQQLHAAMEEQGLGIPDFWSALGYDFIRFMHTMSLNGEIHDPGTVNISLTGNAARFTDWSMAPLSWDASGSASQQLFLFQPALEGIVPADPRQLQERMNFVRARHYQRKTNQDLKKRVAKLQEQLKEDPDNMVLQRQIEKMQREYAQRKGL